MTPVQALEDRFLPLLESARERLAAQFPACKFSVWSGPIGSATPYQGHDVGLTALMPDAHPDQADNVALIIGLMHVTTQPMIAQASVGWGAGDSPDVAIDLLEQPRPFTGEALSSIEREFPRLALVFEQAVAAWRSGIPA